MGNSRYQIATIVLVLILMIVAVPIVGTTGNSSRAVLTDVILDEGVDADDDGTFDFLEAGGQVNAPALAPSFVDAETKFVVYPDGQVAAEGGLKFTGLVPEYQGPPASGFFNLTGNGGSTQASAGLTLSVPPEVASEFPFNSTTVNLLETYSDGILNFGMNSTVVLPPVAWKQYPFNATDGTINITYSGGILNIEIDGNTTLPSIYASQFPFNNTDITVNGTYSPNTLDGTITFSVLDGVTFDDVNVDFTGNQTDFTLGGTVHVIFNVPFNGFIIHNETELKQMIAALKIDLPIIVWDMTGGLLNVTNLDIDYELNGVGATVTFKMDVHGDFVRALAYIMSGGRNEMLLYPALNEAYQHVQSGSFWLDYDHNSRMAAVKLTFAYDLKQFMDYVLTIPPETTACIVVSSSMWPTLMPGDVIFVEPANPGDIVANPVTGDIIAFYHPSYSSSYPRVVAHRAINKTFFNGIWYFRTQGDANPYLDDWTGNNTYNGMISENNLIGKVSTRIPFLGYLLLDPYYYLYGYSYPYLQSTVALSMSLLKAEFSAVKSLSIQLSYSSADKRFDVQYTEVDKLQELADEITRILLEALPPETPPELKSFVESLLNTTYASVSSAQASLSYESGTVDFKATATIDGDLNAELNYVKDLFFQFFALQSVYDNVTIPWPWQLDFINQTKIDVSNLGISAKIDGTSFEGRIQGLTLLPPIDPDPEDATQFKLKRFFNLTAPQDSGQEFPTRQNERLKITVEGGSNATHMITLFRPPTVPEPDSTGPFGRSMTWSNQTLSSLKDLIFKIDSLLTGAIDGTVIDASSSLPIAGATVTADSYSATTDSTGYYIITGIPVGAYTVTAEATGYYSGTETSIVVGSGVTTTVDFTLSLIVGWIDGYVTDIETSDALVGATVAADAVSTTTDAVGYYKIELVPGDHTLTVSASGYVDKSKTVIVTAEETTSVNFALAEPGVVVGEITNPELYSAANPFVVNATEEAATSISITEISDPVKIVVKNVTDPEGVPPLPGTWKVLGNYVEITVNDTSITVNATIRIYYTPEQLIASGLDESTLKIHYWNTTLGEWVPVESHVNTDEHYVWAIIDHFSIFAILGQPIEGGAPLSTQLWFLAIASIVIIAVTIVLVFYIRRRKTAITQSNQGP